ncbi:DoxX family protein [Nocardia flavorosea]|uniref:DoxX family protein n=1 Tax=Nocardia flavorosea TaxID=53429 RepID=UPI000A817E5E|nr:DoxX family protein [Nocardia flavorosea]
MPVADLTGGMKPGHHDRGRMDSIDETVPISVPGRTPTKTTRTARPEPSEPAPHQWNPVTRILFRFCFLYLGLFCLASPVMLFEFTGLFGRWLPDDAVFWQVRLTEPALSWVGDTVFGIEVALYMNGSGDQGIYWVQLFCVLVVALAGTLVWTLFGRRMEYRHPAAWLLLVLRLCVAAQLVHYGLAKVIPAQMPQPALTTLLTPVGDLTPFTLLWNQVGASPVYEILLGAAELTAGVLLFIPRTALVGAILAVVSMAQVFILNMTFGVPVKILSGHLLLMSVVLLAPEARRLTEVLVLNRATGPSDAPYPFVTSRARRIATGFQVALAVWVTVSVTYFTWDIWQAVGPDRPKPPLYGMWSVSDFTRDGQPVPPVLTDDIQWRTVVFEHIGQISYRLLDGTIVTAPGTIDPATHRIDVAAVGDTSSAVLTFDQIGPDRVALTGELGGHPVTMTLHRVDPDQFTLRSTTFRWVQDQPAQ